MQKICYVLVGVSGSGKSTAKTRLRQLHPTEIAAVFSLDDVRVKLLLESRGQAAPLLSDEPKKLYADAYTYATQNERKFDAAVNETWRATLKADVVFVDNTNLSKKTRARWITEARKAGFTIVGVEMMTQLQTVVDRQLTREDKTVPEKIVRDMYMRQQGLFLGEEVDAILFIDGVTGETVGRHQPL